MSEVQIEYLKGYLYVDNYGRKVEYPDYYIKSYKRLRKLQKKARRQTSGSTGHQEALKKLYDTRQELKTQREELIEEVAKDLTDKYDTVKIVYVDQQAKVKEGEIDYRDHYIELCKVIKKKQRIKGINYHAHYPVMDGVCSGRPTA